MRPSVVLLVLLGGCVGFPGGPACMASVDWQDTAVPAALEVGHPPHSTPGPSGLVLSGAATESWVGAVAHRVDILAPEGGRYPDHGAIELDGRYRVGGGWEATVRFFLRNGTDPSEAGLDPLLAALDLPEAARRTLQTPARTVDDGDFYAAHVDELHVAAPAHAVASGPLNNQEIVTWSAEGRDWVADVRVPLWRAVQVGDAGIAANGAGRVRMDLAGDAPPGGDILGWANTTMAAAGLPMPVDATVEVSYGDCGT